MMPLTDSIGGEKLETTKQDPGRTLLPGDVTSIITTLEQLFHPRPHQEQQDRLTQTLSVMFRENQVSIDTALEVIGTFKLDLDILMKVYNHELTSDEEAETPSLNTLLKTFGVQTETARNINRTLNKLIEPPRHYGLIVGTLGTDKFVLADPQRQQVFQENSKEVNGKDYSKQTVVIDAFPTDVVVYDSPISEEPRKFQMKWLSHSSPRPIITGPDVLEEIKGTLMDSSFVLANRLVNDVLPGLMSTYIKQGLAELKADIETPGFFYIPERNEVVNIHYDLSGPHSKEELNDALKCLEDLANWFPGHEDKVASVFKYGLIAPFGYAKKQMGSWIPWPYMYGKARSGKTTLGQMILYMWSTPGEDNDMSGSNFDTVAKVGNRISQTTFPIVVNEPASAFQRVSITEMIKGAIERIVARGRHERMRYRNIPSFAMVILTSNYYVPEDDALIRRLYLMNFTHLEAKNEEDIAQFELEWQTDNHQKCKFNMLKPAAHAAAEEIISDPSLLGLKWQELADTLLTRLYADAHREMPWWGLKWTKSETMEDLDEEHREDIRVFLLERINKAYGQVKVFDEVTGKPADTDNYTTKVKGKGAFKEKVWTVLNERLLPWMLPIHHKGRDHVVFTMGFKREVQKELKVCQPLKGVAELMGWDYKLVKLGKPRKLIIIPLSEFMDFLYPAGDD